MSTLNSEMSQIQQQVVDANSATAGGGGGVGLTTSHNANGNNSVASDSGIESSGASISSLGGASNSNASSTTSPHITNNNNKTNEKNTVSAAADSSDNQPSTPQPQNDAQQQQQQQQQQLQPILHQPYAGTENENTQHQQMYTNTTFPQTMYANGMYGTADQQQQQNYGNFLPNFDTYYQQQQQNFGNNSSTLMFNNNNNNNGEYKRYHPYSLSTGSNTAAVTDLSNDNNNKQHMSTNIMPNNNAVSTTRNISPNLVSSSSPTSTSVHMHYGTGVSGTPNSPNGNNRQCKKCGIMCSSESELQEHVSNVHGSSPYGSSSGYSSSPFIKEETAVISAATTNTGDILDLDSQKMVYPHELSSEQHETSALNENPLHSMHTMQQRALPSWEQTTAMSTGGVPVYYANKQNNLPPFGADIKQEFMKPDFPDSQQFSNNNPDIAQQQQQQQQNTVTVMSIASPVEFPSTTTSDISQDPQQKQSQQQTFRNPPTTGATLANNPKPSAWKSNEARRPKTYNCTACNKWFTSSGHLKRHYNTTLHKNAVKSSNQPDPATLPISVHHHPARDPNSKHNRRNSQQQAQQQQQQQAQQQQASATTTAKVPVNETPVSPTDYTSVSSQSAAHMSNYSASPSPTQNGYQNQFIQQQQASNISPILSGVASPTTSIGSSNNLNGHPNALAGPSVPITPTALGTTTSSSQMRGLLNTSIINWLKNETSMEEDATIEQIVGADQDHHHHHHQQQQQLQQSDLMEQDQQQEFLSIQEQELLEQDQLVHYHTNTNNNNSNNNNNNTNLTSTHTICHQAYLEQQHQMVDNTYSPIPPTQSPQQQLVHLQVQQQEHNTMEQQRQQQPLQLQQDIIQHLDININNMQQQQQQSYITHIATTAAHPMDMQDMQQPRQESPQVLEELQAQQRAHSVKLEAMEIRLEEQQREVQLQGLEEHRHQVLPSMQHCHTLLNNTNLEGLDNMLTHTPINMQPQQHMQRIINMHTMLPLTTITAPQLQQQHTHTQLLQPHTTNTTTIPCFQQLQQQAVGSLSASPALVPLEPTMTYHTIIGNPSTYINNNNNNNSNTLEQQIVNTNDYFQLTNNHGFETYTTQQDLQQQLIGNNDIQILQLVSAPQTSYITFQQQQHQQLTDNDENNEHLFAYNSFVPIENMQLLDQTRANSTQSYKHVEHKTDIFGLNDNNNQHSGDENSEVDQMLLVVKKKTLKRKRRSTKNKTTDQDQDQDQVQEKLVQKNQVVVSPTAGIQLPSGRIKCSECEKTFTKPCYLTQHMKVHAGKCPFRCAKCGKRYKIEEVFNEHVARHGSTNKPHKCQTCEKQFHHKTDLRRHVEVIHKNQKKYVCHVCPKGFCRNDHLMKHIETHFRLRLAKEKLAKALKGIPIRKNKRTTSGTSVISGLSGLSTNSSSMNFEENENNLKVNMPDMPQQNEKILKNHLNTNKHPDHSEDPSPSQSVDEDEDELLQIANNKKNPNVIPEEELPFEIREISIFKRIF